MIIFFVVFSLRFVSSQYLVVVVIVVVVVDARFVFQILLLFPCASSSVPSVLLVVVVAMMRRRNKAERGVATGFSRAQSGEEQTRARRRGGSWGPAAPTRAVVVGHLFCVF
jgi:hypothetical protein